MEFTQEIKDNWLAAVKSGNYTQIAEYLELNGKHCCIGVLGCIHPDLNNDNEIEDLITSPYHYLKKTIGQVKTEKLWKENDSTFDEQQPDYSNVIPLIESLPVTK